MKWLEVSLYTTHEALDPLCAVLYDYGITGVEIDDKSDFAEFIESNTPHWDYVDEKLMEQKKDMPTRIKLYLSDNESGHAMLAGIREELMTLPEREPLIAFGSLELRIQNMDEEDWANNWKQYYKPLNIGEKLLIKPTWEQVADAGGRTVVQMDPGMAFGTGTHSTTSLCLETLEKAVKPGDTMLDLGCGSGILAISALLLGADHVTGVDIDPNAVNISGQNAAVNNLEAGRYRFAAGNVLTDDALVDELAAEHYDIVAANIVADVIIALTPKVERFLKPGGLFIASGIINVRKDEVERCFAENGYHILSSRCDKDWYAYTLKK